MFEITRKIVREPSGWFIQDWDYSQGYLTLKKTTDIFSAIHVDQDHFKMFFKDCDHLTVTLTATATEE